MTPLVTFFPDYAARSFRAEAMTLAALVELIGSTTAPTKAALPWLKMCRFGSVRSNRGSLRHDANVAGVSGVECDYDGETVSLDEAIERLDKCGITAIVYTSPSYRPEAPRWRVLFPLSAELPPDRRYALVCRANGIFAGTLAPESWSLSQSYYFGSVADNPHHRAVLVDGTACLDQADELDLIAIGRPNGGGRQAGERAQYATLDESALEQEIVTGHSYHLACTRLVGRWAQQGVPFLDAQHRLEELFDSVFPPDRDQRWRERRADVPKIIRDIYGKHAAELDERVEFVISGMRSAAELDAEAAPDQPEAEPEAPQRAGYTQAEFAALEVPPADRLLGVPFSTTSRAILIGPTGIGKTNLMLGMAVAMSEGKPFLHWPAGRRCRVLYVDGEMSVRLFKERSADAARRNGGNSDTLVLLSAAALGELPPLNYPAGQRFIDTQLDAYGGFDFVFFDNIQALLLGDMKDEDAWRATLPWVRRLTNRGIGQVWGHHTGIDKTRGYGTSTREWQMDAVILLSAVEGPDTDLSFTLEFLKARERSPINRANFETCTVMLTNDEWVSQLSDRVRSGVRDRAFDLLRDAVARWGVIPGAGIDGIPAATPCVTEEQWYERYLAGSISEANPETARRSFKRAAQQLVDRELVGIRHPWVWIVR